MSGLTFKVEALYDLNHLMFFAEILPEFGQAVLDLLDAGEELFILETDDAPAFLACEIVVRLDPSKAFLGRVPAVRASNHRFFIIEHDSNLVSIRDTITGEESVQ